MDEIYGRSGVNETKGQHRGESGKTHVDALVAA